MEIETNENPQILIDKGLIKVLLVEDDVIDRKLVERILAKSSEPVKFAVESVGSLSEAIECLTNREYNIVIADLWLPDSSGIETVQKVCEATDIPIMVLTGIGDEEMGISAIRKGATDYLVKAMPLNILLVRTIVYALERKKATEALARSESKFRTLVEHLPKKIFIKDKNSAYLFSNQNYAQDLKIKSEEIIGKTDYDFYPKELAEKYRADDKRIIETGKTEDIEEKYVESGEERWVHTIKTPYKDAKGNIIGVLGIFRDITDQKKTQEFVIETNRHLQETAQKLFIARQELEEKHKSLEKAREELEKRVDERTAELLKANTLLKKEITKRKQAEEALQASEANLRKVIVTNPDGIVIVNRDGIVQFVNPAAGSLFGRKAEEIVGELLGLPLMKNELVEVDIVNHGGGPGIAEMRVVETEWNGQSAYLALLLDITERKCAKEQIENAAKEWRTTFDSITDMISIHDKDFKITRVNKALAKAFKKEPKELIGKTCYELFHGAKQPCQNCPHIQSLKTKEPATLELFEPCLGIHLDISTSPVLDENGEILSSVHIAKNISERVKMRKALEKSEEQFRLLSATLPIGVFEADNEGGLIYTNTSWQKLFGVTLVESTKMNLRQILKPAGRETVWTEWKTAMREMKHYSKELPVNTSKGEDRWMLFNSAPLLGNSGIRYTGTIVDITSRKLAEEQLKEANEKLKEYNQLKDEFVSTASHELRTPLSIIMGAIRLILDEIPGKIVTEQKEVLETAMAGVKRLGRIVDSLLSISKIESGTLELHMSVVNVCELVRNTISDCRSLAEEKNISLSYIGPQKTVDTYLDPDKTREVLINLLSNSLKFTPESGWVKVSCAKRDGEVLVSVQDSGVGIAQKDIPKLFDKFTQFGRKAGPGEKGTGLGLAIAKKLVEMHGGKIEVESVVDQGTTFTVSLPLTSKPIAEGLTTETDKFVENTIANN